MNNQDYEFKELGPVWHLCTSGKHQCSFFRTRDDYVYGMNLVALAASNYREKIKILTFQLMSNHFHFVMACDEPSVKEFFDFLYKKMHRYLAEFQRASEIQKIEHKAYRVEDLRYLKTVITYVNRNGYLANQNETPFTYEWGANNCYFNPQTYRQAAIPVSELKLIKKREMFKSRNFEIDGNYKYLKDTGYIAPYSYCCIDLAESFYRDAHDYFHLVSRQVETYSQIARELGDTVTYTDEELYSAVFAIIGKRYDVKNPVLLGSKEKIEMAKQLKYEYNATNKQIQRLLKLDENTVETLFPKL